MNICLYCNKETKNNKFCNHSCAMNYRHSILGYSKEIGVKIGIAQKGGHKKGGWHHTKETKKNMSISNSISLYIQESATELFYSVYPFL